MDSSFRHMSAFKYSAHLHLDINILYDLLDKVAIKYEDYYIFNHISFRKLFLFHLFDPFIESLKPFYLKRSQHYLTKRPVTYNMVTTILRQFCSLKNIEYKIVNIAKKGEVEHQYYIATQAEKNEPI